MNSEIKPPTESSLISHSSLLENEWQLAKSIGLGACDRLRDDIADFKDHPFRSSAEILGTAAVGTVVLSGALEAGAATAVALGLSSLGPQMAALFGATAASTLLAPKASEITRKSISDWNATSDARAVIMQPAGHSPEDEQKAQQAVRRKLGSDALSNLELYGTLIVGAALPALLPQRKLLYSDTVSGTEATVVRNGANVPPSDSINGSVPIKDGPPSGIFYSMNGIPLKYSSEILRPTGEIGRFVGSRAKTMTTDLNASKLPMTLRGAEFKFPVQVGEDSRLATIHLPPSFNPEKPTPVYFLADGAQYRDPAGEMLHGYHWAETSDTNGFVAVALEQSPKSTIELSDPKLLRLAPQNTSWRTSSSFLNKSENVDDVAYFENVSAGVSQAMRVAPGATNFVGFCDGGVFGHVLASKTQFNGLATVASTFLKDITPSPLPGTKAVFATMTDDQIIPPSGGPGRSFGRALARLGHTNITKSDPLGQAQLYAEVNQLKPDVTIDTGPSQQRTWRSEDGAANVFEISIKEGGHNWPGTLYDSASRQYAQQLSEETAIKFNQLVVDWFQR